MREIDNYKNRCIRKILGTSVFFIIKSPKMKLGIL